MRLSAKMMKNVIDVNHWQHANQNILFEGQSNDVYIQLVDLDYSTSAVAEQSVAYLEYPIRYIPQGAVIQVTAKFDALDSNEVIEIVGTNPFPQDTSIFKFALSNSQLPNTGNLIITLNEDDKLRTFIIRQAITVELFDVGGC